jgi:16S rRNA processing protein RimM
LEPDLQAMTSAAAITPTALDWPADAVEVGRVIDAWGVKGWIKVQPYASDPQALFSSRRWHLQAADAAAPGVSGALPRVLHVTQARHHGELVVAAAQDLNQRDDARALRGARIFVSRGSFPTAQGDEYYWVDLIGAAVVNRQGVALGQVVGLVATGPHSVLRVRRAEARDNTPEAEAERLIPFVAAYVDEVDLAARRIVVDWGLDF